jgi:hypothetical protein
VPGLRPPHRRACCTAITAITATLPPQAGHWTYECKNEPAYTARPTRTQQLKNPKVGRAGPTGHRYAGQAALLAQGSTRDAGTAAGDTFPPTPHPSSHPRAGQAALHAGLGAAPRPQGGVRQEGQEGAQAEEQGQGCRQGEEEAQEVPLALLLLQLLQQRQLQQQQQRQRQRHLVQQLLR